MTRAVPPPEHLDYLQEIGVDIRSPTPPSPVPAAAASPAKSPRAASPSPAPVPTKVPAPAILVVGSPASPRPRRLPKSQPAWWPFVEGLARVGLFIVMLLLLLIAYASWTARAEEVPSLPAAPEPAASTRPTEEHATVKRPSSKSSKGKSGRSHQGEWEESSGVERHLSPPTEQAPAPAAAKPPAAPKPAELTETPTSLNSYGPRAEAPQQTDATPSDQTLISTDATHAPLTPRSQGAATPSLESFIGLAFLAGLGCLSLDRFRLSSRIREIEEALGRRTPEATAPTEPPPEDGLVPLADRPGPPALLEADTPEAALRSLFTESRLRGFHQLPRSAARPWGAGVASITGNVRRHNEDAAIAFEVGSTAVLIVADGLGGLPHGKDASRLAVGAAALSVAEALAASPSPPPHPELVAQHALLESAAALCHRAMATGRAKPQDGFRTTFIAVVATPSTYGYAYLGDGGGIVVRHGGRVDGFLVPHKANGIANVVTGSLGPVLQGTPAVGTLPRQPGDSLVIGTDGVFDRIEPDFAASVVQLLQAHRGDAQAVTSLIVSDFAAAKQGSTFMCDDNLTLAILCTPPPRATEAAVTLQRPAVARR